MYEVGPGIRYWAHRNFAINLTTGFRGDYRFTTVNGSSTGSSMGSSTGINAIFVSLGGIGAF
jgi:hypothetical protein